MLFFLFSFMTSKPLLFLPALSLLGLVIAQSPVYAVGKSDNFGSPDQSGNSSSSRPTVTQVQQAVPSITVSAQGQNQIENQVNNRNATMNQGESNQIRTQEQERTQDQSKSGSAVAEQRRSKVANAVQEMLQVADRTGGIGQQVRTIAQTQTQNQEKLEASLEKVQSRSSFAKFFVGPNYGEINNAKKLLEQNQEQLQKLNQLRTQLANQSDQQELALQIAVLEQASAQIQSLIGEQFGGFSLFGWMFRFFAK